MYIFVCEALWQDLALRTAAIPAARDICRYMYVRMYTFVYMCTHTHTQTHTHTHTHTHTELRKGAQEDKHTNAN